MPEEDLKPLNWKPEPGIGYDVIRRPEGGLQITFWDVKPETLLHWREFSLQHLYDSDRLTRNLYDLRQIDQIPEQAVRFAVEVNSDPSVRNIRLAVVVGSAAVRAAIQEINALSTPGGVEMGIFTTMDEAEAWLARPLTMTV